jgi:multidrug transporter EmrE-like cation transporter
VTGYSILQPWMPFLLIALAGFVSYNICAKVGGGNLPPVMFASIMYTTGFVLTVPLFLFHMHGKEVLLELQSLPVIPVLFAIGAGIAVIFIDISISAMFNRDAPMGVGMASLSAGSIAITTVLGFVIFKENFSVINICGILMAIIAVPLMFYKAQ